VVGVGQDYLLSAQPNKPLLNAWQVNRGEQLALRLFTPGPPTAMAVSPSGNYLVVAVQENINIWMVGTGELLAVVTRHYQAVRVLAFTEDGSHFLSGGEDGQVLVWSLVQCVAKRALPGLERGQVGQVAPRYTWTDHSLPVTCIHVGCGVSAATCRVFTGGLDQVVRVYSMAGGAQLLAVSLPSPVLCLVVDRLERVVWAGTQQGGLHSLSLTQPPPRDRLSTSLEALGGSRSLSGHSAEVTQLSLSMDSHTLASGCKQGTVLLWDTASGQTVRTITLKGATIHLSFLRTPPSLLHNEAWNPQRKLVALQKGVNSAEFCVNILRKEDSIVKNDVKDESLRTYTNFSNDNGQTSEDYSVEDLKEINHQIYKFALNNLLNP